MRSIRGTTTIAVSLAATALATGVAVGSTASASLTGHGRGTWHTLPGNPDTGTQRAVVGAGHFSFGSAKVRGGVSSPGFIANGDCSVSLRLVTAKGSIAVVGHSKRTSSSYPTCIGPFNFAFHTTKALGDLAGDSFKGVGHLDLEDQSANATDNGAFTLKLSPVS
jgi:hypothetical protein